MTESTRSPEQRPAERASAGFDERRLGRIRRAAALAELRMRIARALAVLPTALTLALAAAAIVLVVRKVLPHRLTDHGARWLLAVDGAVALLAVVVASARRLPPHAGTVALDRFHALSDRLTNALAFLTVPASKRTALMDAAIDDACERAASLSPGGAAPIPFPKDIGVTALVACGVVALALLRLPTAVPVALQAKQIDALTMSPDDIELFRDAAKQFDRNDQSPEMKAAVERFNQLIEDLANKRLDRTEAFRRMEAIERELLSKQDADKKAFDEALDETAQDLKRSELSKPVAESLEKKDLEKTKQELKQMAEKLRKQQKKPDKKALERLREALAKAAQRKKEALAAINERRAELREQLLKKKQHEDPDAGPKEKQEERLLKKKERELERLDREAEQKERVGRQLDRLDRDLAKAAEDLMKDLGLSAQDLDQAAEDINRLQEEQLTDKEKEELRQRLEELRELLRQQGQGGKQRMARLLKFGKRARGQGGKGEKGQGQPGAGEDAGDDGQDDGQQGENGKGGQGNQGEGKTFVLGAGGKKILIPGGSGGMQPGGDGPGAGQGQGAGQDGNGGNGTEPGGKGIGTGHDGRLAGKATDLKGQTTDIQEQGLDTQQGPSNSKVIYGAAERGFKGGGYKKVYTDYHTVAEQQINKDQVPDGYRFYVHRYFQLIRPRE
ncbi:MAG TPA: hypothetical protein VHB21_14855 [Minicystis sp.]|nr:hypothetical protein [Minicystis sp.]